MLWIAAAAVLLVVNHFWEDIIEWASTVLADAVGDILGQDARDLLLSVLVEADQLVATTRLIARKLWHEIKATVLQALVDFEKVTNSTLIRRLTSYLAKNLDGEKRFVRVVQEETIDWDDLPAEVRESFVRTGSVPAAKLQLPDTLPARLTY